ncbi:pentatricopeptide repeat-containing protein At3g13160, mitochondrial-like [Actinidia eriantha]|uniref:pentatricopeptide repeat-containing protein At3g13160, mitochondrial-like n=1 Tax=Actinidia eriantha TaxID=165200 RepID=UPI002582F563|nr:pentatricopeptide repeat-containing protein At3g13160, mitochondrial-like [Actinidia eriantha]
MSSSVYRRLHGLFTATKTTPSLPKSPKPTTAPSTVTAPAPARNLSPADSSDAKTFRILVKKFKKASDSNRFRHRNHRSYETTVRRLAAAQKFSDIEDILEHQKKYPDITNEGFVVRLICLYGKSGMFDHAQKLFDEMPQLKCERTVMSLNALLSACVSSKKFDKIGELLSEIPEKLSIKPDLISYNTVIKAFCEMGSFDSAYSVIEEMEKNGLEPDLITFNTLLDAFYRNERFSDAEKVWELMKEKNVVPNARSYNPKLRALVAGNRIPEASELIEEMGIKGIKPDVFSYSALIKGFYDNGMLEEAKEWYKEMAKNDFKTLQVTFTKLGSLACEKGDFDFALELCKEAISQRCLVYSSMMQLVVDGLVKESKMEQAKELVELGKSNGYFHYKLKMPLEV